MDACILDDESGRPDIKWIRARLSNPERGRSRWMWIMGVGVLMLSLIVGIKFYSSNDNVEVVNDKEAETTKTDSVVGVKAMGSEMVVAEESADPVKDEIIPKSSRKTVTKEAGVKASELSVNPENADTPANKDVTEIITGIVDKYVRKADDINKRYGKLSYTDNIEENQKLRIKRANEHFALSDNMERELSDLGIDKSKRNDAYHRLWTYIVFETNRIDGADEVREQILRQLESKQ